MVESIYKRAGKGKLCVRVYTPPVIPHTYNYMFSYYSAHKGYSSPSTEFQSKKCYFIMEKEQEGINFQLRVVKWRSENVPVNGILLEKYPVSDNTSVEVWTLQ